MIRCPATCVGVWRRVSSLRKVLTYSPLLRYYRLRRTRSEEEVDMAAPYVGTAGWSYPHWNGVVYPKMYKLGNHPNGFHPLEFLSQRFDAVEINNSFYQPLKPELAKLWMKKVVGNPKFQFTAKLNQRFTHARDLDEAAV